MGRIFIGNKINLFENFQILADLTKMDLFVNLKKIDQDILENYVESCALDVCMVEGNETNVNKSYCDSFAQFDKEFKDLKLVTYWRDALNCRKYIFDEI